MTRGAAADAEMPGRGSRTDAEARGRGVVADAYAAIAKLVWSSPMHMSRWYQMSVLFQGEVLETTFLFMAFYVEDGLC